MSQRQPIRVKGPITHDLVGMSDEDFERMDARLIRLEHPTAFKPANVSDGGADMVEPTADRSGYTRCWQSKHYPRNIRWDKCEKSLADARKHWNPAHYTFIFPRDLTIGEQKTFYEKFGSVDIRVDHWNGEEIQSRLTGSDAGQRVARTFFDDAEMDRERTYQAIEAGGRLEKPEDAIDRAANLGSFLAGHDAYFSYPMASHEQGGPAPATTPGSVMSFAKGNGQVVSRVDVVPRDDEAMERYGPEFVLEPSEGEAGQRAIEQLNEALREGKGVEIEKGLDLTFTRMPPGFVDFVGERLTGHTVVFGEPERVRRPIPPWTARLHATSGEGDADIGVQLTPVVDVPEGWDTVLSGQSGGLTVTAMLRRRGEGGEMQWNVSYRRPHGPVSEWIAALRFMRVISAPGETVVTDEGPTGRPDLRIPTPAKPFPSELRALLAFLEDVRVIEEWAEVEYEVPADITGDDARSVATVAQIVRSGGREVMWNNIEVTVEAGATGTLHQGRVVRIEMAVQAKLLGRVVDLGYSRLDIGQYTVASEQPLPRQPGRVLVRIEPRSADAATTRERLTKLPTAATRRPPPPPRRKHSKAKRKGGAKKGGGNRRRR